MCVDANECEDEGKPEASMVCYYCKLPKTPYEIICIHCGGSTYEYKGEKVRPVIAKDLSVQYKKVEDACTCSDTDVTIKVLGHAGPCEKNIKHNPSTPWGGCQACIDEGLVDEKPVEDMTTKELVESQVNPNPVAHVVGEKILHHNGILAYSSKDNKDGKLILESIVFRLCRINSLEKVIGVVDERGRIFPATPTFGLVGRVDPEGSFAFNSRDVNFDKDEITVSYNYEYFLPEEQK